MFNYYILQPFIDSSIKYASNNAFFINEKVYTYFDFAIHITKIRHAIQLSEYKTTNIGLVVNDDIETYASIFAIWFEGLAYVPLHPHQPYKRSVEIITQSDIDLLIDSSVNSEFKNYSIIKSSSLCDVDACFDYKLFPDDALAYILFTSGSTGNPKGVQITRRNVGAFMKSFWETGIQINDNDRCLQCFDLTFDVSIQSFLVPLTKGACTYTIPHDQIKYSYVFGLLEDQHLTFGAMAPSMLRYLRPYFDEINIPSMRYNILTAEASPLDLIIEWSECIPNAYIYDFYGPTEATIYCTFNQFYREGNNKQLNGMLSIGKPMPGLKAIIIDDEKNILETNQKGELCISGDQLTPGYWKNLDKNNESFFEIEFDGIFTRFYKTGDAAFIDDEADIMLSGRLDYQVKIQGYRIELGEIEYYARECLNGENAVAISFENKTGNAEIALFIERESDQINSQVLEYLAMKLPYYMLPTIIIATRNFPLNLNGKIDRNLLRTLIII